MTSHNETPKEPVTTVYAPPHVHTWYPFGVKNVTTFGVHITYIALMCRTCGDIAQRQLNGDWTLREVIDGRQS